MSKYVLCPKCELNYMPYGFSCCRLCDLDNHNKSIAELEADNEAYRQAKMEAHEARRQSMEDFFSYRYNRKPKRV